jgi:hypothetical protein
LRRDEQRLERRQEAIGTGAGAAGLAAAADRAVYRRALRDGQRLSEGGRHGGRRSWPATKDRLKTATTSEVSTDPGGKTGHFQGGVHRSWTVKTGHFQAGVSTDSEPGPLAPPPGRAPSASAWPVRELIAEALSRGRNARAIWQDLVDDHGFRAGYASVKRFVAKLRGTTAPEARVVITTAPGEEGQVDYGDGPMVRDAATGRAWSRRRPTSTAGRSAGRTPASTGPPSDRWR